MPPSASEVQRASELRSEGRKQDFLPHGRPLRGRKSQSPLAELALGATGDAAAIAYRTIGTRSPRTGHGTPDRPNERFMKQSY
jgi:hypothetical protein